MLSQPRAAAALLLILAAATSYGRDIRVTVLDRDLSLPLEGAIVRAPDGKDYETDSEGVAVVRQAEGSVVLRAAYPGYGEGRVSIAAGASEGVISLVLSGLLQGAELVVEAQVPRANETRAGRSVAISGSDLARSAEVGVFEDVMNSIKLLPGVGYAGMFNSHPSIRGGDPGDMVAVFDGFYVENPYHFGGAISIFDPRMIESAQLSHGIFSTRYGHSISGILDITAKKGDTAISYFELGASSSAANVNVARPIGNDGSWTAMLKATYWAPFVWLLQGISTFVDNEQLNMVNAISVAPYVVSGAASANYRFTPKFHAAVHGYVGFDGGAGAYENPYEGNGYSGYTNLYGTWQNSLGFAMSRFTINPAENMALDIKLGLGFNRADLDAKVITTFERIPFNQPFIDDFDGATPDYHGLPTALPQMDLSLGYYSVDSKAQIFAADETDNIQARIDYDIDLGKGFILAAGVQELYSLWLRDETFNMTAELPTNYTVNGKKLYFNQPYSGSTDAASHAFTTSGYALMEWTSAQGFLEVEAGLRVDTFTFFGKNDFNVHAAPALNPRLNVDLHLWKNESERRVKSLSLVFGTGLFSSMPNNLSELQPGSVSDYELQPNRTWTSLAGVSLDLPSNLTLNIEAYYKYVFSRGYSINWADDDSGTREQKFYFDGYGNVFGADALLRKPLGDYVDGWFTYTFTYARYAEPAYKDARTNTYRADGYYPSFHRFHNANFILNIKPAEKFHIYLRMGFASGQTQAEASGIDYYPVYVLRDPTNFASGYYIQKYKRIYTYSDTKRTPFSLPIDAKFSWFFFNKKGRTTGEFYLALENLASLFYVPRGNNTTFNAYTGKEDTGTTGASYELPVPMASVGMKWSF